MNGSHFVSNAVDLSELATAPNLARAMCACGKRFADVTAPDATPLCLICAKREARSILHARRLRFEAKRRADSPVMAIPKKRSRR